MTKKLIILFIAHFIALSLASTPVAYAASPASPSFQTPPDDSWWSSFIPENYQPSNVGKTVAQTVWGLLTESLADWIKGRFDQTIAAFQSWLSSGWDLKNKSGLLGGALDTMFDSAVLMVIPWIGLSITVTFFQKTLSTVFPGVVRNFSLSQHMGRLLIIIFFMNEYMLHALLDFTSMTSTMAFSMALGAGSGLVEWEWITNIMSLVAVGALSFTEIILVLLLLIALFIGIIIALLIKHLAVFFLLAALPLVAAGWLFAFTEKYWGKFWWMYLKLLAFPFILAFALKIIIAILSMLGSSVLIGLVIVLLFWGAMAWIMFKFLMMPETLMIAAGAGLSAVGAGAVGVPMMVGGGAKLLGRASGDSRTAHTANMAYRGYQTTQGQVDVTDVSGGGGL